MWNQSDIDNLKNSKVASINQHLIKGHNETLPPTKKHKYAAQKTEVNGIVFDSKKEARRYKELLLLIKAGEIGLLELQVAYELNEGGTHSLKYIADFVYMTKEGLKIVEDSKGFKTKEYLKKKRLMLKVHGIKINES
jgi:hypothetical protein